jgi:hypothetical protein
MTAQLTYLVDPSLARIATLNVRPEGDLYRGTINLDAAPAHLKRLFEEFEENVEGQMFSLADEVEAKIEALRLKVVFADGTEAPVEDL